MDPISGTQPVGDTAAPAPADIRRHTVAAAMDFVRAVTVPPGCALAATGSLARAEMTPYSDIDVMLIRPENFPRSASGDQQLAAVGYALWDGPWRVDHSVRTPAEAVAVTIEDATAGFALLDLVHISGDKALTAATRTAVLAAWRRHCAKHFQQVTDTAIARWARSGSLVTMTRPDIKHGRGGLRDHEFLRALSLANLCDTPDLSGQRRLLLDVRTLLHVATRRSREILDPEFAVDIARQLGYADRYELAAAIAQAGRDIDKAVAQGLLTARSLLPRGSVFSGKRRQRLDVGVVDAGGYVTITDKIPAEAKNSRARDVDPDIAGLPLRVAAAAARSGLPVPGPVWKKMRGIAALPAPWPKRATEDFLAVLSNPATLQPLVAAMDANGLWENFVPEWPVVRGLVPREPSHTHTVDTHLVHTVANCGRHTVQVARPDLLLLAALFHDMGKGTVRPHSQVGAEIAARAGARMGLVLTDRAIVQNLVAEHTTLMRLAVTCAPDDPRAVDRLVEACHWDPLIIDLLFELTRADGLATGPRVWTRPVEQAARSLVAGAKAHLSPAIPSRPYVWLPPGGTLRIVSRDPGCEMTLRAVTAEEIARLVSLIGAKGWLITDYRMVQAADRQPGIYNAVVGVRTTSPGAVDEKLIVEAHKSGVFTRLPEVAPAPTVVHWYTPSIGEVRTADRKGVLGQLLKLLPVVHWSSATTPGSTVIARFQLPGSSSGPAVEKSLMAALAGT